MELKHFLVILVSLGALITLIKYEIERRRFVKLKKEQYNAESTRRLFASMKLYKMTDDAVTCKSKNEC